MSLQSFSRFVTSAGRTCLKLSCRSLSNQRLVHSEFGDPTTVVTNEEAEIIKPPDKVLVKMLCSPVNPADLNIIQGMYARKPESLPAVPGMEGVGVVIESVAKDTKARGSLIRQGDWVIPMKRMVGTWQSYLLVDNDDLIQVPQLDLASIATLSINPCTAYRMLKDFTTLVPGDLVIQNGGNSAVGQAVIQLCREFKLKSVSTIRPRENLKEVKQKLESLGNADTQVVTDDELKTTMGDVKAELALNCVGGASAAAIVRFLGEGRPMVTYGGMSRQPVIVPTGQLIFNDVELRGFWMTKWSEDNPLEKRMEMMNELFKLVKDGKLKPPEHKMIPLSQYKTVLGSTMKGFASTKYLFTFE